MKTVKIRWRLGDTPPDPLNLRKLGVRPTPMIVLPSFCQILGAPLRRATIFSPRNTGEEKKGLHVRRACFPTEIE